MGLRWHHSGRLLASLFRGRQNVRVGARQRRVCRRRRRSSPRAEPWRLVRSSCWCSCCAADGGSHGRAARPSASAHAVRARDAHLQAHLPGLPQLHRDRERVRLVFCSGVPCATASSSCFVSPLACSSACARCGATRNNNGVGCGGSPSPLRAVRGEKARARRMPHLLRLLLGLLLDLGVARRGAVDRLVRGGGSVDVQLLRVCS